MCARLCVCVSVCRGDEKEKSVYTIICGQKKKKYTAVEIEGEKVAASSFGYMEDSVFCSSTFYDRGER